jgi:hypothetical protein
MSVQMERLIRQRKTYCPRRQGAPSCPRKRNTNTSSFLFRGKNFGKIFEESRLFVETIALPDRYPNARKMAITFFFPAAISAKESIG